jgi:hypothetical protein
MMYEFGVNVTGVDFEAFAERLYESGGDDATVCLQAGQVVAWFSREAASLSEAVATAIQNVMGAGATVLSIEMEEPTADAAG